jgi:hypothetical protein
VLGHPWLGDPELGLDDRSDRAGGLLAVGQQFQDPAAYRVPEDIERVHRQSISASAYISQA